MTVSPQGLGVPGALGQTEATGSWGTKGSNVSGSQVVESGDGISFLVRCVTSPN
jgi:hypothetical protein